MRVGDKFRERSIDADLQILERNGNERLIATRAPVARGGVQRGIVLPGLGDETTGQGTSLDGGFGWVCSINLIIDSRLIRFVN